VQDFIKIKSKLRPYMSVYRQTDRMTDRRKWFYNLSHAMLQQWDCANRQSYPP